MSEASTSADAPQMVAFEPGDPSNPYNWSKGKKMLIILLGTLVVFNTTLASSLPSLAQHAILDHFHIDGDIEGPLPNSIYLVGYILGPTVWAPLSEHIGRRWITMGSFIAYAAFEGACTGAPTWGSLIGLRLLTGICGSAPISLIGGLFADVLDDPVWRGRSIAWFVTISGVGPFLGPVVSGCMVQFGWQWPFWLEVICAGACAIPLILFLPETFAPALLQAKAKKFRKEHLDKPPIYAPLELQQHTGFLQLVTRIVARPLQMIISEPIVAACCIYLALVYSTVYMLFQSFGVIYPPIYGFGPLQTGLAFLPMTVGAFISLPVYFCYDAYLRNAKSARKSWAFKEEFQRLPLACLGGPLMPIGMFWIGWTARKSIHWIVPMLGGLPFGLGFILVFIALYNYMVDAYKIYSASAVGATSIVRSVCGVVLPFAARPMYETLGVGWACSLLGFASAVMCAIPWIFISCGPELRARSRICRELAGASEEGRGRGDMGGKQVSDGESQQGGGGDGGGEEEGCEDDAG
ncbi:related to fluconazole resistance protein (FLU1) [Ramularia collo-cygni]|uniref:Related to fluconazole resistance protein (FLU1) n=1 Tax=Ramularia collo-cygni TaxID=112498 RepID=A0A2D3V8D2_9PEZI|nr:related to fluconazole resistance protein (FLU1) [Ramularia collo-cygni]CZT16623.1 related to fluconazole resistance protein (FLU1) [Ramularia collo-cygni]